MVPPQEIISHLTLNGCEDLTAHIDSASYSSLPISHGGFGEVYRGAIHDGRQVAIKALRVSRSSDDELDKLPKVVASYYVLAACSDVVAACRSGAVCVVQVQSPQRAASLGLGAVPESDPNGIALDEQR
ncbi:hypothetical protein FRC07_002447 [Ceratobasidium sp. 392]|nr:hypothetical protein FRC07_002447 [Ceratobasidium sp. 392]